VTIEAPTTAPGGSPVRRALILLLAGCPGLLALLVVMPDVPGVPRVALLAQPAVLLLAGAMAGAWAAPRCGFVLADGARPAGRAAVLSAGLLLGLALAVVDHAARGLWQAESGLPASIVQGWSTSMLLVGLLYGGVLEEVVWRWAAMSLVTLALWRSVARRAPQPPGWCIGTGIALSAVLCAAGHVPTLALGAIAPGVSAVLRTLLANAALGVVYGLAFARRDLLAAIMLHAGTHGGFALAATLLR